MESQQQHNCNHPAKRSREEVEPKEAWKRVAPAIEKLREMTAVVIDYSFDLEQENKELRAEVARWKALCEEQTPKSPKSPKSPRPADAEVIQIEDDDEEIDLPHVNMTQPQSPIYGKRSDGTDEEDERIIPEDEPIHYCIKCLKAGQFGNGMCDCGAEITELRDARKENFWCGECGAWGEMRFYTRKAREETGFCGHCYDDEHQHIQVGAKDTLRRLENPEDNTKFHYCGQCCRMRQVELYAAPDEQGMIGECPMCTLKYFKIRNPELETFLCACGEWIRPILPAPQNTTNEEFSATCPHCDLEFDQIETEDTEGQIKVYEDYTNDWPGENKDEEEEDSDDDSDGESDKE